MFTKNLAIAGVAIVAIFVVAVARYETNISSSALGGVALALLIPVRETATIMSLEPAVPRPTRSRRALRRHANPTLMGGVDGCGRGY